MTRLQRLAEQEARTAKKLASSKDALAKVQAETRAETQKARQRRRYAVGILADQAGLLAWDDATLAGLFAALARLSTAPNPVALLEGLMGPGDGLEERVEGIAHAGAHGVPPTVT